MLETEARKDLENDGCPACYPPHLDVPVRNPPEEYRPIIDYWQSFSSTDDVVLCAQRSDWRRFRASQVQLRNRYQNKPFSIFVNEVRDRRRRYGPDVDVHLLLDSQQQSQQQNWIEFQNYHLRHHERLKKQQDGLKKNLGDAQKEAGDTNIVGSERAVQNEVAIQRNLEYTERTLQFHEIFLGWIEQQRLAMDPRPPTPVEEDRDNQIAVLKAGRRASTRQLRSRRLDSSAVLGKVRVSKPTPKSRNV